MYADRLKQATEKSITERLKGIVANGPVRRRPVTGKRQREDDKWEHDLYDEDGLQLSISKARKLGRSDLRLKLQKTRAPQNGVPDLREKLSGTIHAQPENANSKPKIKSVIGDANLSLSRKVSSSMAKKKTHQKGVASVDGFLLSLGLEKYKIQFRAEEVDMMALKYMTDEDLKAMGIPMGPRKKISSALSSIS